MDRRKPVHDLMNQMPAEPGSYMLQARLAEKVSIKVGALGIRNFLPGFYIYCGSANGPGGLKARIGHHLMPSLRPSWHFDFLKPELDIESVWFISSDESLECSFVRSLCAIPQASQPMRFFGSRDCRSGCQSHLVSFPFDLDINIVFDLIKTDHPAIRVMPVM